MRLLHLFLGSLLAALLAMLTVLFHYESTDFAQAILLNGGSLQCIPALPTLFDGGLGEADLNEALERFFSAVCLENPSEKLGLLLTLTRLRLLGLIQYAPCLLLGIFAAVLDGALARKSASETFGAFLPRVYSAGSSLVFLIAVLACILLAVPRVWVKEALTVAYMAELLLLAIAIRHFHRFDA